MDDAAIGETTLQIQTRMMSKLLRWKRNAVIAAGRHATKMPCCVFALNQFEPVTPSREEGMIGLYYFAIAYSALDVLQATCRRLLRPASIIDDVVDHGEPIGIYARSRPENGGELTETWWFADGALQLGHRPITVDHRRGLADQLSN
ncbi:hypothetical protein ASE23_29205 [Rhizobium sp. Root73]|nr:hypothetical protein ASE23_29205 [Rhizobium sp. Root73]